MSKYNIGNKIKLNATTKYSYGDLLDEQTNTGYLVVGGIKMCDDRDNVGKCRMCSKFTYSFKLPNWGCNVWWCEIEDNSQRCDIINKPKPFKLHKDE